MGVQGAFPISAATDASGKWSVDRRLQAFGSRPKLAEQDLRAQDNLARKKYFGNSILQITNHRKKVFR
jgi:hypothetical protein